MAKHKKKPSNKKDASILDWASAMDSVAKLVITDINASVSDTKKEQSPKDDPKFLTMYSEMAVHLFLMYKSYLEAGFTSEQAMFLLINVINSAGGATS